MILAINTAFMTANLALCTADGRKFFSDLDANCKHSENVLKTIEQMCEQAKLDILDIDTLAVVTGPGSFTGLRIGTAIAKALGCANEKLKFISLSSLSLMAYIVAKKNLNKGSFICALNALSNLFFVAHFNENGILCKEEEMIDKAAFDALQQQKFVLAGDLPKERLYEIEISSEELLEFALMQKEAKNFCERNQMLPKYLRLSQAEDALLKKNKND